MSNIRNLYKPIGGWFISYTKNYLMGNVETSISVWFKTNMLGTSSWYHTDGIIISFSENRLCGGGNKTYCFQARTVYDEKRIWKLLPQHVLRITNVKKWNELHEDDSWPYLNIQHECLHPTTSKQHSGVVTFLHLDIRVSVPTTASNQHLGMAVT